MTRQSTSSPAVAAIVANASASRLYSANAFRVLGLRVDAPIREIGRRAERLAVQLKFGKRESAAWDAFLGEVDQAEIVATPDCLADPERRLLEEAFWLWPLVADGRADPALEALENGDTSRALKIWEKTECEAAAHNLAVYNHAVATSLDERMVGRPFAADEVLSRDLAWESALAWWVEVLGGDALRQRLIYRAVQLEDPRATRSLAESVAAAMERIVVAAAIAPAVDYASHGDTLAVARHLAVVRACGLDDELVGEEVERRTLQTQSRISSLCKAAEDASESSNWLEMARVLHKECRPLLELIDAFYDASDLVRSEAHDNVASVVSQCLIKHANATKDWFGVEVWYRALPAVASSPELRRELQENLVLLRENVAGAKAEEATTVETLTCWFCGDRLARSSQVLPVPLHRNAQTFQSGSVRRTTWETSEVAVPRCGACITAHDREDEHRKWGRIAGGILGVAATFCLLFSTTAFWALIELLVCTYAGLAIGRYVARRQWPPGTQPKLHVVEFGPLAKRLKSGWELGAEPGAAEAVFSGKGPFARLSAYPRPVAIGASVIALVGLVPLAGEQAQRELWGIRPKLAAVSPATSSSPSSASTAKPPPSPAKTTSQTPARTSSPSPNTSWNGTIAAAPEVPSSTSAPVESGEVSRLRIQIDAERRRLKAEADEIDALESELNNLKSQINALKPSLQRYERDINAGLDVDRYGYQRALDRHNSLVDEHNDRLAEYRTLQATHKRAVEMFNADVEEYNRLINR